ncbi:MAG: hypothetical protein QHH07_08065 [Sedimentisphaerales bacterium]|nr:hypothetical protein [Sedimentisphaerales bacterium]
MRHKILVAWIGLMLLAGVAGCERLVLSTQPIGTEQQWIIDPNLEGRWASGDQIWEFGVAVPNRYRVRVVEGLRQGLFDAHLTRIADHLIMDLEPNALPSDLVVLSAMHLAKFHSFWLIQLAGPRLEVSRLRPDRTVQLLGKDPNAPASLMVADQLILTGQSDELRAFLARHMDANDLWLAGPQLERLAPLGAKGMVISDPNIVGIWTGEDLEVLIRPAGQRSYRVWILPNDQGPVVSWAYLLDLKGRRVMLLYLDNTDVDLDEVRQANIPEMALVIEQKDGTLDLRPLEVIGLYRLMQGQQPQPGDLVITLQKAQAIQ